jgi:diphosphomevalonate decarboxylase
MVTAAACANIALIKYWGKRDVTGNIPAAGSLSLTLEALRTTTTVELCDGADRLVLDGKPVQGKALARITKFADLVRAATGKTERVAVTSENTFPTAAGLASSASAFAALAVAVSHAFGQELSPMELSILARRGSGSAARSIFGGFARMTAGDDAHAYPLEGIDLRLGAAIAVANAAEKEIGSTDGMEHTRLTSPYHAAWIETVNRDLDAGEELLRNGDVELLAELVEGNCLAMHANAMAARPGIIYFKAPTLWAIDEVRRLRKAGTPVFFTIDAGPHVVAFTPPDHLKAVSARLAQHPAVREVITSLPGRGARVVDA